MQIVNWGKSVRDIKAIKQMGVKKKTYVYSEGRWNYVTVWSNVAPTSENLSAYNSVKGY